MINLLVTFNNPVNPNKIKVTRICKRLYKETLAPLVDKNQYLFQNNKIDLGSNQF